MHRDEGSGMRANSCRLLRSFAQRFFQVFLLLGPKTNHGQTAPTVHTAAWTTRLEWLLRLCISAFTDSNALTVCFPTKWICQFQVVPKATRLPLPKSNHRGETFFTVKQWQRGINIFLSLFGGCCLPASERTDLFWSLFFRVRSSRQMAHLLSVTHWLVAAVSPRHAKTQSECQVTTSCLRLRFTADWWRNPLYFFIILRLRGDV